MKGTALALMGQVSGAQEARVHLPRAGSCLELQVFEGFRTFRV